MRPRILFPLIAVVSLLFLLLGNSGLAITDPVESNYTLTAKEMVLAGDWISPRIYGVFWYDKPIFIYWMLCLSYTILGITDFASRLPGALFGAASAVLAAWYMWCRTGRTAAALLFAAMTVTSLEVWAISHSIITDQMLFFFTGATMFFAYIGLTEGKKGYVIAAYAMAGFAVLTKGPVGIVLPGLFLLVFAGLRRNMTYIKRMFPPVGIAAFLLISLSWYGTMYSLHGMDFINGFLGFNNVVRATVSEHPEFNVWYYYIVLVPVSLLPWTGPCLYGLWKQRGWNDDYVYMTVWAAGTILFYTLMATKYPTYSYIANLPLLYIGTETILSLYDQDRHRLWTIVTGPALLFWVLFMGAAVFAKTPFPMGSLTWLIVFLGGAIILLVIAQWLRAVPAIPIIIAAGTAILYGMLTFQVLQPFYAYRSSVPLVINSPSIPDKVYVYDEYSTSFVYYTGRTATYVVPKGKEIHTPGSRSAVWAQKYRYPVETEAAILQRIAQHQPVSIIVPKGPYQEFLRSPLYKATRLSGTYQQFSVFTAP